MKITIDVTDKLFRPDIVTRFGDFWERVIADIADGFGGVKVGYTCPYCHKYVPYAGKFCGKCGMPVHGGEDDAEIH